MYLAPVLEPPVMRTVDLHHLAETVASSAPLVQPALVLTAQCPNPGLRHSLAQRLLAQRMLMLLKQPFCASVGPKSAHHYCGQRLCVSRLASVRS